MKKAIGVFVFKIVRGLVKFFYPETEIAGIEKFKDEEVIFVGNHAQMNGPIVGELYFPENCFIWCASQMMELKQVPAYAFSDFWSGKPGYIRWFYKILSYVIAPLSVAVFNNAKTIPVYHDVRIIRTFRKTSEILGNGGSIVIFPEHNKPYNNIIWEFRDKFIDVAKFHYKRTGKEVVFVPMYVAPALKKTFLGNPVRFDSASSYEAERTRICRFLMDEVTRIAGELPKHTVVPYPNMPKKLYPINNPEDIYET